MVIKIEFYPEAEDWMDVKATEPLREFECLSIEEAEMALGLIERHELPKLTKESENETF